MSPKPFSSNESEYFFFSSLFGFASEFRREVAQRLFLRARARAFLPPLLHHRKRRVYLRTLKFSHSPSLTPICLLAACPRLFHTLFLRHNAMPHYFSTLPASLRLLLTFVYSEKSPLVSLSFVHSFLYLFLIITRVVSTHIALFQIRRFPIIPRIFSTFEILNNFVFEFFLIIWFLKICLLVEWASSLVFCQFPVTKLLPHSISTAYMNYCKRVSVDHFKILDDPIFVIFSSPYDPLL